MDEAFLPIEALLARMLAVGQAYENAAAGVRTYINEFTIDTPVELDVGWNEDGKLRIGTTPPLYYVDTSLRPSYHRLKFVAQLSEDVDGP